MRSLLPALLLFLAGSLQAQMHKTFIETDESNTIHKLHFLSPAEGFAAFEKWIGFTQDSGKTFVQRFITPGNVNFNGYNVNLTFGFAIKGVHASSTNDLLAYGHYGFVPAILSSHDGGNSFTLVYHGTYDPNYLYRGVLDMYFSGTTGYAVSDDRVLKTTNNGASWTTLYNNATRDFLHLNFLNNSAGMVIGLGRILKTTDGGTTWQALTAPAGTIRAGSFFNEQTGWVLADGFVYRTANSGADWSRLNDEYNSVGGRALKFFSDSIGYALSDTFTVLKTTDGGKYWEKLSRDNTYSYLGFGHESFFFLDSLRFWAGGGHGFLERTTNGGGTSVPPARFMVDFSQLGASNTVKLVNKSKPGSSCKWFRNATLFATTFNASYPSDRLSIDTIRLVVTRGQFSDTAEQIIDTKANPYYRCNPAFVLSADTGAVRYVASDSTVGGKHTWYFGDGSLFVNGSSGTHQYDSVGTYTVKQVVTSDVYGCKDSLQQTISIPRTRNCLVLDFTATADTFFTNRLQFKPLYSRRSESADGAMTILEWNWGDGKPADRGGNHQYDAPGQYNVCLKAQNWYTGCISTLCKKVAVYLDTTCNADFVVNYDPYQNKLSFVGKPTTQTKGIRNTWTINNRLAVQTGNNKSFQTEFFRQNYGETNFDLSNYSCGYPITLELGLDSTNRTLTRIVYDTATGCTQSLTKAFTIPRKKNVFIRVVISDTSLKKYTFYAYELDSRGDTVAYGYSSRWRIQGPGGSYYAGGYTGTSTSLAYTFQKSGYYTVSIAANQCNSNAMREVYFKTIFVSAGVNKWTAAVSAAWEDPLNWSLGVVPDENTDVVIESGIVQVNSKAVCRTLTTNAGTNVVVSTGGSLNVIH